jgi:hypothetical protein
MMTHRRPSQLILLLAIGCVALILLSPQWREALGHTGVTCHEDSQCTPPPGGTPRCLKGVCVQCFDDNDCKAAGTGTNRCDDNNVCISQDFICMCKPCPPDTITFTPPGNNLNISDGDCAAKGGTCNNPDGSPPNMSSPANHQMCTNMQVK